MLPEIKDNRWLNRKRKRRTWHNFFGGVRRRIPLCCNVVYCVNHFLDPKLDQGYVRGSNANDHGVFIPCLIWHESVEWKRMNNIGDL